MTKDVIVVGGGYGGVAVAKALDEVARVVLVEPREAFLHNVAALRGAVDPAWTDRLFIPYGGLLARGEVRRDRAVRVSAGEVELASGEVLAADYVVLATGSTAPYPAKIDTLGTAAAVGRLRATREALVRADHVLLLGAGPVGLEFAGEIAAAWPGKRVTLVDPAGELLSGRFPDEFRSALRDQLDRLGVTLLLGAELRQPPGTDPGRHGPFTVTTTAGDQLAADLWFRCYGVAPRTDYLDAGLRAARTPGGHLDVTPELRVAGHPTVFAVGDITALPELKLARAANAHAEIAAANIRALLDGRDDLRTYQPQPDAIVLPLGPTGGVTFAPEVGVLGPEATADLKATFYLDRYQQLLGAIPA
jgi:NADH dehydrogenase FAD-containing subunit